MTEHLYIVRLLKAFCELFLKKLICNRIPLQVPIHLLAVPHERAYHTQQLNVVPQVDHILLWRHVEEWAYHCLDRPRDERYDNSFHFVGQ
jgi:hypothetical protein